VGIIAIAVVRLCLNHTLETPAKLQPFRAEHGQATRQKGTSG
jgi:hypothetical protein